MTKVSEFAQDDSAHVVVEQLVAHAANAICDPSADHAGADAPH